MKKNVGEGSIRFLELCLGFLLLLWFCSACQAPIWNLKKANRVSSPLVKNNLPQEEDCLHRFVRLHWCFKMDWQLEPKFNEEGRVRLIFYQFKNEQDQGQIKINDVELRAYLWMPEHGHGSAPAKITKLNDREYVISYLWYIMPGLWDLHIDLIKEGSVVDSYIHSQKL